MPQDWSKAAIVPVYKGKGDKTECNNYRGISLLSIPGKVYCKKIKKLQMTRLVRSRIGLELGKDV